MTSATKGRSEGSAATITSVSDRNWRQILSTNARASGSLVDAFVLADEASFCWNPLMKISQKLEYACRALSQLARQHDGKTLTRLEELSQREAVSANFLVQILNDLRRAGLVESRRGKTGGYLLHKSPDTISLRQIVEAVDPALLEHSVSNQGESGHGVQQAWTHVSNHFRQTLDDITLDSLANHQGGPMFYI